MPRIVCLIKKGVPDFDTLHGRTADHLAVGCAFDLLMHDGDDLAPHISLPVGTVENLDQSQKS
jgi:hypothetical protein